MTVLLYLASYIVSLLFITLLVDVDDFESEECV